MTVSSSEKIRVSYIKEVTKGVTPAGNMTVFRMKGDSLSGTPKIVENEEITPDAQPTGQNIVGLDVGGALNGELAPTVSHQDFIEAGMRSTWSNGVNSGVQTLTIDTTAKTITRAAGDFTSDGFVVGDMVVLSGFSNAENNTVVYLTAVAALSLTYAGPSDMVDETGDADEIVTRPDYVDWGSTDTYFTLAKDFLDLTDKSITYPGERVGAIELDFRYGAIATCNFTMAGIDYDVPSTPLTDSHTVDAVATEEALNATSDLGTVIVDGAPAGYCIEGLNLKLDNNIVPVECLGSLSPKDQAATGLTLNATMDVFLEDGNFDFHSKKLTQTPVNVSYFVRDENGAGYAVHVPALQFSFPDAGSQGRKQISKLSLQGVAKKDGTLGRTIRIYKLV